MKRENSETMKKEVVYRGMIINAEKGLNGRTVYRVLRFRDDGKVVSVPWTYATIESAQDYITQHGF